MTPFSEWSLNTLSSLLAYYTEVEVGGRIWEVGNVYKCFFGESLSRNWQFT